MQGRMPARRGPHSARWKRVDHIGVAPAGASIKSMAIGKPRSADRNATEGIDSRGCAAGPYSLSGLRPWK